MTSQESEHTHNGAAISFYDVAAQLMAEVAKSDARQAVLKKLVRQYPEFAADLVAIAYADFVAGDEGSEFFNKPEDPSVVDAARRILSRLGREERPLTSLTGAARDNGMSPHQLAENLRIDVLLLAKLEQRLVSASSIPSKLLELISTYIDKSVEQIVAYVHLPPQLATNARYKSRNRPTVQGVKQESFADALAASRAISAENRAFWMNQSQPSDL